MYYLNFLTRNQFQNKNFEFSQMCVFFYKLEQVLHVLIAYLFGFFVV